MIFKGETAMRNTNSNKKELLMLTKGKRLKECRKENGFTQEELAEKVSCSSNLISMIECGKRNLTEDLAVDFSKLLHVSKDYLLAKNNYKTIRDERKKALALYSQADTAFKLYLQSFGIDVYVHLKGLDTMSEDEQYLNNQPISFHDYNTSPDVLEPFKLDGEDACIIYPDDITFPEIYEIDYITISDPIHNINIDIDEDTYVELQDDIESLALFSIERLPFINNRKQSVVNKYINSQIQKEIQKEIQNNS